MFNWLRWRRKTVEVDRGFYVEAGESPRPASRLRSSSYGALSDEGYSAVGTVYRCVDLHQKVGRACLRYISMFVDEEVVPAARNWGVLVNPRRPNLDQSLGDLYAEWLLYLLVSGKTFLHMTDANELLPLCPANVSVVKGQGHRQVVGYDWVDDAGRLSRLAADRVLYTRFIHPRDWYEGLSPITVAAGEVDLSREGVKWNLSLMQRQAKPPFAISLEKGAEASITEKMEASIRRQLRDQVGGASKAGEPLILRWPGMVLTPFGWSPVDLDWKGTREDTTLAIANVFAVPPELLGLQKTYENFATAWRVLHEGGSLPLLDLFCEGLSAWGALGLADNEHLEVDRNRVPALQEGAKDKAERLGGLVDRGIATRNEARKDLGLGNSEDPAANELTVRDQTTPLGLVGVGGSEVVLGES
jgi:HK97 family phage portal protein